MKLIFISTLLLIFTLFLSAIASPINQRTILDRDITNLDSLFTAPNAPVSANLESIPTVIARQVNAREEDTSGQELSGLAGESHDGELEARQWPHFFECRPNDPRPACHHGPIEGQQVAKRDSTADLAAPMYKTYDEYSTAAIQERQWPHFWECRPNDPRPSCHSAGGMNVVPKVLMWTVLVGVGGWFAGF